MKSEEPLDLLFDLNPAFELEPLRDESLDINLTACAGLSLDRNSTSLLDIYLPGDDVIDFNCDLSDLELPSSANDTKNNLKHLCQQNEDQIKIDNIPLMGGDSIDSMLMPREILSKLKKNPTITKPKK